MQLCKTAQMHFLEVMSAFLGEFDAIASWFRDEDINGRNLRERFEISKQKGMGAEDDYQKRNQEYKELLETMHAKINVGENCLTRQPRR